ncbi:MAG: hypothetical protein M3P48_01050, partial [Actinomycetota bacterium]|nr:hypothetical protein [Actinomycetota bacterium]
MSTETGGRPWPLRTSRSSSALLAAVAFALITAALLVWAKWWPYTVKLGDLTTTRQWTGASILAAAGEGGGSRWAGAWHFTWAYTAAVWKALVA